jgi:hypothetical protein
MLVTLAGVASGEVRQKKGRLEAAGHLGSRANVGPRE